MAHGHQADHQGRSRGDRAAPHRTRRRLVRARRTAGDNPETNSDLQRCAEVGAEYGKPMGRIEYLERAGAQDYERELSLRVVVDNPECFRAEQVAEAQAELADLQNE